VLVLQEMLRNRIAVFWRDYLLADQYLVPPTEIALQESLDHLRAEAVLALQSHEGCCPLVDSLFCFVVHPRAPAREPNEGQLCPGV
jgi:hypothetical protein